MRRGAKAGIALSVSVAILMAAAWLLSPEETAFPPTTVRLATIPGEISAPIWIAEAQGYFVEQNLEMEIDLYQTGADAVEALLSGKADFATCVEYVIVRHGFERRDLRILAVLTTAQFTQVVARRSSGMTGPRDLIGKTIGVPLGTHIDYYLARFLALHQIGADRVTVTNMQPSEQLSAIQDNRAAAVVAFEPYLTRIKRSLSSEAVTWGVRDHDSYWVLVSTAATLRESSSVADRILRSLIKAEQMLASDTTGARQIVNASIRATPSELISWEQYDFDVGLPQSLLAVMEEEARWIIETRLTSAQKIPNYLNYIDYSALQRTKSRGVTIIR
jgi:ABC-type nitrate/sulfonate/bicarbonate transport system substrate-binding protein